MVWARATPARCTARAQEKEKPKGKWNMRDWARETKSLTPSKPEAALCFVLKTLCSKGRFQPHWPTEWRICDLLCKSNYVLFLFPRPLFTIRRVVVSNSSGIFSFSLCFLFVTLLFFLSVPLSVTSAVMNSWLLHFQVSRTENRSYIQIKRPSRAARNALLSSRG